MNELKTYSKLITLPTFEERFNYLKLGDKKIGEDTFAWNRYLNQMFYHSPEWKQIRNKVIARDYGRDLGTIGREIYDLILIHHMNPITIEDVINRSDLLLNPEYLICASDLTHKAIHFGSWDTVLKDPIVRTPNDTCPWKK